MTCIYVSVLTILSLLSQRFKDEPLIPQRAMLPVLLSTVPQQDSLQAGLPAPRAHLQPHVWRKRQPMDTAPVRSCRLAVLGPREGRHRVFHDTHLEREPDCLHVCPLLTQRPLHTIVLPRKRSGLGPDEQLLHWPGFTDQLQCLLLRLLGLWGQFWEAIREEPLRWCWRCLAGTPVTVRWWMNRWMEGRSESLYADVAKAYRGRMEWLFSGDKCTDIWVTEKHIHYNIDLYWSGDISLISVAPLCEALKDNRNTWSKIKCQ